MNFNELMELEMKTDDPGGNYLDYRKILLTNL